MFNKFLKNLDFVSSVKQLVKISNPANHSCSNMSSLHMSLLLFGVLFLVISSHVSDGLAAQTAQTCAPIQETNGPGTTYALRAIYEGICFQTLKSELCSASWTQFEQIVLSKNNGNFTWQDFNPLFSVLSTRADSGKSTFWTGEGVLVHRLSRANPAFATLEDTFPASALNSFFFCPTDSSQPQALTESNHFIVSETLDSNRNSDDKPLLGVSSADNAQNRTFNMQQCVQYISPGNPLVPSPSPVYRPFYDFSDAFGAFWQAASIRFASTARGQAYVVFEVPDEGPAFCSTDFFPSIELRAINLSAITGLEVMVATNELNPTEKCDSGSFIALREIALATFAGHPISFTCKNDPYDLTLVRCGSSPESDKNCKTLLDKLFDHSLPPTTGCGKGCGSKQTFTFLIVGVSIGTFIVGFLLAAWIPMLTPCFRSANKSILDPKSSHSMTRTSDTGEEYQSLLEGNV